MPVSEIAYAEKTATEFGFDNPPLFLQVIPFDAGQTCFVPMQRRPCYLFASAIMVGAAADTTSTLQLGIYGADLIVNNEFVPAGEGLITGHGVPLASGARINCLARLPAFTPGREYLIAGSHNVGGFTVVSPVGSPAYLLAYV